MNDINLLMDRITEINTKDPSDLVPTDIDALVLFYRHRRTRKAELQKSHDTSALDSIVGNMTPAVKINSGAVRRFIKK